MEVHRKKARNLRSVALIHLDLGCNEKLYRKLLSAGVLGCLFTELVQDHISALDILLCTWAFWAPYTVAVEPSALNILDLCCGFWDQGSASSKKFTDFFGLF